MVDGANGSKPTAIGQRGRLSVALSGALLIVVLVIALVLSSTGKAPEGRDDSLNPSDEVNEDKLVTGVASDFILNQSAMGADWNASGPTDNPTFINSPQVTSSSYVQFWQLNSSGDVHFRIDILVMVLDSIDNASSFYNEWIELDHQKSLTNVSIGDRGVIVDGPQLTMGQGVKWLFFLENNVVCEIQYQDMTSEDPLPNELLIDLANKVGSKIG